MVVLLHTDFYYSEFMYGVQYNVCLYEHIILCLVSHKSNPWMGWICDYGWMYYVCTPIQYLHVKILALLRNSMESKVELLVSIYDCHSKSKD